MEQEDIEALIRIYASSARNLKQVADLAAEDNPDSIVAHTSRAKATTYLMVIDDLKDLLGRKEG